MRLLSCVALCVLVSCSSAFRQQYDTSEILTASSPPKYLRTVNFPNTAPPNIVQIWNYKYIETPGVEQGIDINCRVSVPQDYLGRGCTDNVTFVDGRHIFPLCGSGTFFYTTFTNEVTISLITGPAGGTFMNCALQVVSLKRPDYLKQESQEVDSSEHGGEEGEKGTTCPCGWANKATSRIVNGTMTAKNEFPFMARIVLSRNGNLFCGGTIISRYHVLTAAHCTDGFTAKDFDVVVGGHDMYSGEGHRIPLERISQHLQYDDRTTKHDISLLTLKNEIPYNQFIGPACLPQTSPKLNLEGQYITSIGWGAVFSRGWSSRYLLKVHVKVIPMDQCHEMWSTVDAVNPTQICDYSTAKSACQGDSGGPVVWVDPETNRYTLVGITSFGKTCADYHPNVETRVQAYLDWVQREISRSGKPKSQTCSKA